jgi:ribosomal protein S27AE
MDDERTSRGKPQCPICGGSEFQHERGKIDSQWGVTAHRVDILVCGNCGYVLLFYEGNTIFDFD